MAACANNDRISTTCTVKDKFDQPNIVPLLRCSKQPQFYGPPKECTGGPAA